MAELYNSKEALMASIHYCGLLDMLNLKPENLSFSKRDHIVICRLLACQAKIWLLDEIEFSFEQKSLEILYQCIESKLFNGGINCTNN